MKVVDGELKILPKNNKEVIENNESEVKIDGNYSSSNLDTGIDFKTAIEAGSKFNNEKISSISSDLSDSSSSFEFVPFDTAMNTDNNFDESMFTGDATELPSFSTFNNANDYRFYFTHTYQQGDE